MLMKTQMTVPIEVITTTVQRSVRYVVTNDPEAARKAVLHHTLAHPECYDDIDEIVVYHHDVSFLEDAQQLIEMPADIVFDTPEDLLQD